MSANADLYRRFVDEVVVGKNVVLIDELFDPDATLAQGSLDGLRAQMAAQAAGLDITVEYLHQFTDGEWVITHMAVDIAHTGEFMGHPPSGKRAHIEEVESVRVVAGRIAEMWSVGDFASAFIQLGLPVPGTQ
jgi:predicted ester cyclase